MTGKRLRGLERGSALLLAMILLTVLSAMAAAAIVLSSQERQNAATKSRLDALQACAQAAQAKIWADVAQYSTGYFSNPSLLAGTVTLPDGTKLVGMAHYDTPTGTNPVHVTDVAFQVQSSNGSAGAGEVDCTNALCGMNALGAGKSWAFVAHCVDPQGRQLEVELAYRFAL